MRWGAGRKLLRGDSSAPRMPTHSSAPRMPTYYLIAGIYVGYMILSSLALYLCTRQYRSRLVATLTEQCASLSSKHAPTTFKVGWTSPFYQSPSQHGSSSRQRGSYTTST